MDFPFVKIQRIPERVLSYPKSGVPVEPGETHFLNQMKAKIALFLMVCGMVCFAHAQPQPISVAVLHFDGPRKTLNNNLTALLTANLSANPQFSMVERADLDKILSEQSLGKSGTITPESAANIGKLTGAKILIVGREFNGGTSDSSLIVIASVVGAENGRVYSQTVEGTLTNLVKLVAQLGVSITQTITNHTDTLLPNPNDELGRKLKATVDAVKGKKLGRVSITISESIPNNREPSHVTEIELGKILQKAGFTIVDEKSDQRADIVVTGDAVAAKPEKRGDLFFTPAMLQIKAREMASGNILSLDSQRSSASGLGEETTAKEALAVAADELAERLIPTLAK
jgi:hypothetical protein